MKRDELVTSTRETGRRYEKIAEEYLSKKGFELLERNYQFGKCEIDLIFKLEKKIIFVEVKYRKSKAYGQPYMFISRKQKLNIIKASAKFVRNHKEFKGFIYRFDVVSVLGDTGETVHYPNAFTIDEFKFIKAL